MACEEKETIYRQRNHLSSDHSCGRLRIFPRLSTYSLFEIMVLRGMGRAGAGEGGVVSVFGKKLLWLLVFSLVLNLFSLQI